MLLTIFRHWASLSIDRAIRRAIRRAAAPAGALAAIALLAGCAASPSAVQPTVYDFGLPVSALAGQGGTGAEAMSLAVDVDTPPWFDSPGIGYRLAYDDPLKRREYVDSRWAANPGQLLTQRLRQQLGVPDAAASAAGACALRIELQEFSQVFDSPQHSRALLQATAILTDATRRVIAERRFVTEKNAATPDARGGVGALVEAGNELGQQLAHWLGTLNAQSAGRSLCRTAETAKPRRH